jgi:hypothetical protein
MSIDMMVLNNLPVKFIALLPNNYCPEQADDILISIFAYYFAFSRQGMAGLGSGPSPFSGQGGEIAAGHVIWTG